MDYHHLPSNKIHFVENPSPRQNYVTVLFSTTYATSAYPVKVDALRGMVSGVIQLLLHARVLGQTSMETLRIDTPRPTAPASPSFVPSRVPGRRT